jgi:SAM-dependent methyltransferase
VLTGGIRSPERYVSLPERQGEHSEGRPGGNFRQEIYRKGIPLLPQMLDQVNYWNKVASTKRFTTPFDIDLFSKYVGREVRILDYGCAYGRTLKKLKNNGYSNLWGVDFSEKMIERAEKENSSINFKLVKNNRTEFENNSFNAILLLAVLTCAVKNEEQERIMEEIKRILKPNGILYINDFLLNEDKRNLERYNKFKAKYGFYGTFELEEGAILRHFKEDRIKKLTSEFEELEYEKIIYTTMNGNKSNGFYYIGKYGFSRSN